jgi:NADH-quinone oxidoreductase subunit C
MTTTLPPRTGMGPDELGRYLRDRLERDVTDVTDAYGTPIVTVTPGALPRAARLCKSDPNLAFDFFDWLSAVDLREEGLAVVVHLYSTRHRHHVQLRTVAPGGRTAPRVPSLTGVYRGANWHERETYDMFGVTFDGHPGLLPRLLTVENFEGWPLRKEFLLTTREAKPWPGAKEPEERHEEPAGQAAAPGAAVAAAPAGATAAAAAPAPAPAREREEVDYDRALYDQLIAEGKSERIARSRAKAAAMRARRARPPGPPAPRGAPRAPWPRARAWPRGS